MRQLRPDTDIQPRRFHKLVKFSLAAFLVIFLLEIWTVNRLATFGDKIQQIEDTRASLELENQYLKSQIAEQSSLPVVEKKAAELGFVPMENLAYLQTTSLAAAR